MSTQELLTCLLNVIAISFMSVALFDFSERVIALYKKIATNPTPAKLDGNTP